MFDLDTPTEADILPKGPAYPFVKVSYSKWL